MGSNPRFQLPVKFVGLVVCLFGPIFVMNSFSYGFIVQYSMEQQNTEKVVWS